MTMTLEIHDREKAALERVADRLGVSMQDYLQSLIQTHLQDEEEFESASTYVLKKNEELYQRLAK